MSLTSIVGPLLMTSLFYYFSKPSADIYFPGAAMIAGSILTIMSAFLARLSLKKNIVKAQIPKTVFSLRYPLLLSGILTHF